ncbi:MAG: FABP family protein [Pseudoclavibacter sp.]
MVYDIPTDLPPEIVPLSWLLGVWEGTGHVEYKVGEEVREQAFRQRVSFSHDGLPYLNYSAQLWLEEGTGDEPVQVPLTGETGFWRLARTRDDGDVGPGYLPPSAPPTITDADGVEGLRDDEQAFPLEVSIVHPTGLLERYSGSARGPRIDLKTEEVLLAPGAKEFTASTRMYGYVAGELLWAWDIAALGQELATHASAKLAKLD